MSENLEDNEPRIIPPAVGNTQNEHVERSGRIRVAFFRCRHSRASGTSP